MTTKKTSETGTTRRTLHVRTSRRTQLVNLTAEVVAVVRESGCENGVCHLYIPHTTAGVIINEGYDPSVAHEIESEFDRLVPVLKNSSHDEGNSDSHVKTALAGSSETIFVENGKLRLGQWQVIYFADFDGPRHRELWVKIVPDPAS
ncbi:MAG: secondary thiamine-phosphate synthase enzyme YjbQ [Candidatus Acidiferrales bacterium]